MPREQVIAALGALSERELELTLAELTAEEQEQVRSLVRMSGRDEGAEAAFDSLAALSPWLLRAIDRARSIEGKGPRPTPAALAALSAALAGSGPRASERAPRKPRQSRLRFLRHPRSRRARA